MTAKFYCNLCDREVNEMSALFLLRKHGIAIEATVNTWGKREHPRVASQGLGFGGEPTRNHICHRCLLDICRTGTPDPNGWNKQDMIELGIVGRDVA